MSTLKMFSFLLSVHDNSTIGRLPPRAWKDAGFWLYAWDTRCVRATTAIRLAVNRCLDLRAKTGADWDIDQDMHVGPKQEIVSIPGDALEGIR